MVDQPLTEDSGHPARSVWWALVRKVAILVVGVPVTLAGLVMLVTPGPGIPVLIAGLAILSVEFTWAERHVDRMRSTANSIFRRQARPSDGSTEHDTL